eukprot:TRINITY_DN28840_c0_g1_i1.p1 TRINITY_DN28840_c0_g1~~TRINITY_DN28840_c0_g1_i1.p1  ORF type:complete len:800 (-),score=153.64 TRINITY_DN28840_c0_g1_i1:130-2529(-)
MTEGCPTCHDPSKLFSDLFENKLDKHLQELRVVLAPSRSDHIAEELKMTSGTRHDIDILRKTKDDALTAVYDARQNVVDAESRARELVVVNTTRSLTVLAKEAKAERRSAKEWRQEAEMHEDRAAWFESHCERFACAKFANQGTLEALAREQAAAEDRAAKAERQLAEFLQRTASTAAGNAAPTTSFADAGEVDATGALLQPEGGPKSSTDLQKKNASADAPVVDANHVCVEMEGNIHNPAAEQVPVDELAGTTKRRRVETIGNIVSETVSLADAGEVEARAPIVQMEGVPISDNAWQQTTASAEARTCDANHFCIEAASLHGTIRGNVDNTAADQVAADEHAGTAERRLAVMLRRAAHKQAIFGDARELEAIAAMSQVESRLNIVHDGESEATTEVSAVVTNCFCVEDACLGGNVDNVAAVQEVEEHEKTPLRRLTKTCSKTSAQTLGQAQKEEAFADGGKGELGASMALVDDRPNSTNDEEQKAADAEKRQVEADGSFFNVALLTCTVQGNVDGMAVDHVAVEQREAAAERPSAGILDEIVSNVLGHTNQNVMSTDAGEGEALAAIVQGEDGSKSPSSGKRKAAFADVWAVTCSPRSEDFAGFKRSVVGKTDTGVAAHAVVEGCQRSAELALSQLREDTVAAATRTVIARAKVANAGWRDAEALPVHVKKRLKSLEDGEQSAISVEACTRHCDLVTMVAGLVDEELDKRGECPFAKFDKSPEEKEETPHGMEISSQWSLETVATLKSQGASIDDTKATDSSKEGQTKASFKALALPAMQLLLVVGLFLRDQMPPLIL